MGFNNFSYEEKEAFKPLAVGDYRIRIAEAEKMQSKSGKDMLKLVFDVSGSKSKLYHYIVDGEYFNSNVSRVFDAFPQIDKGNFNLASWVGKIGACHTKQEEYNGNVNAKIHYFISAKDAEHLPAWVEPEKSESKSDGNNFVPIADDVELPFT